MSRILHVRFGHSNVTISCKVFKLKRTGFVGNMVPVEGSCVAGHEVWRIEGERPRRKAAIERESE